MHVILHADAKKAQSGREGWDPEGFYTLQTDCVDKKPCWYQENGLNSGSVIWKKDGLWLIGTKKNLGSKTCWIYSPDDVENPLQALNWKYWNGDKWIESSDIVVSGTGNIIFINHLSISRVRKNNFKCLKKITSALLLQFYKNKDEVINTAATFEGKYKPQKVEHFHLGWFQFS